MSGFTVDEADLRVVLVVVECRNFNTSEGRGEQKWGSTGGFIYYRNGLDYQSVYDDYLLRFSYFAFAGLDPSVGIGHLGESRPECKDLRRERGRVPSWRVSSPNKARCTSFVN